VNDGQLDSNIATVVFVVALTEDGIEETGTEETADGQTDPSGKSATIRLQSKRATRSPSPSPTATSS
jgi:hypothetical protein